MHHIESTNVQQNYTLLHTTQASNSQATSTDDSAPCVVSTANLIPVTLVLCLDPVAALELIPAAGVGPLIVAHTSDGDVASKHIIVPSKLSEYWLQLYEYSNKLQCCENFFSATQPSVPCLICHPFGE